VCIYLACASSLRGVKSERSCGCNQFPVGLAVKPTWAAHAGQTYYYAARERRRRTRARAGPRRGSRGRERVANGPFRNERCGLRHRKQFHLEGRASLAQHPASQQTRLKLNARERTRGWARALAMRACCFLDDPRFPRLRREARTMIGEGGGVLNTRQSRTSLTLQNSTIRSLGGNASSYNDSVFVTSRICHESNMFLNILTREKN